ncbi:MAG: hypothetical protein HY939_07465 [Gammaproteobacteria bacterium]|nr:hypothetical protein [Gammaproteobacteria bacterium]
MNVPSNNPRTRDTVGEPSAAKRRHLLCSDEVLFFVFSCFPRYFLRIATREQWIELAASQPGLRQIMYLVDFLNELNVAGYDEILIHQMLLFDQTFSFSPSAFITVHRVLQSYGLNHVQIASYFASHPTLNERMHYLTEFAETAAHLSSCLAPARIINVLITENGLQKIQYFIKKCKALKACCYEDEHIRYLLTINNEIVEILIRFDSYLKLKVDCNQLIDLLKSNEGIEKITRAVIFLMNCIQRGYSEEKMRHDFFFNREDGLLSNELMAVTRLLQANGFDDSTVMDCFSGHLTATQRVDYLDLLARWMTPLLVFFLPKTIVEMLKNQSHEGIIQRFRSYHSEFQRYGYTNVQSKLLLKQLSEEMILSFLRLQPYIGQKFDHEKMVSLFLSVENREKMKHLDEFLSMLRGGDYSEASTVSLLVFACENGVLSNEFTRFCSTLEKNGFGHEQIVRCVIQCWLIEQDTHYFKNFVKQVKTLSHFLSPQEIIDKLEGEGDILEYFQVLINYYENFRKYHYTDSQIRRSILEILKSEDGLDKLRQFVVHYQALRVCGYTDLKAIRILKMLTNEVLENIIHWHDDFTKIVNPHWLFRLIAHERGREKIEKLLVLLKYGFDGEKITACFNGHPAFDKNQDQLSALAGFVPVLSRFLEPEKIVKILNSLEGLQKLQYLVTCVNDGNNEEFLSRLMQSVQETALATSNIGQFSESIMSDLRRFFYSDLYNALDEWEIHLGLPAHEEPEHQVSETPEEGQEIPMGSPAHGEPEHQVSETPEEGQEIPMGSPAYGEPEHQISEALEERQETAVAEAEVRGSENERSETEILFSQYALFRTPSPNRFEYAPLFDEYSTQYQI